MCVTDALRVSQRYNHTLSKVSLKVTLLDTWPHLTSCAVKVTGFKDDINQEMVTMFFESEKRSGGSSGAIEDLVIDEQQKSVVVVFHSRDGQFYSHEFFYIGLINHQILHFVSLPGVAHGKSNPTKLCQTGGKRR